MLRRRKRILPKVEVPDLDVVFIHGFETSPEWVQENARQLMEGFDDLPKHLRDRINYAETPEAGARAVSQILSDMPGELSGNVIVSRW